MLDDEQLAKATAYNMKKDGSLWSHSDLPWPFTRYQTSTGDFAVLVCFHQMHEGLADDGMLGPNTLASIQSTFGTTEPSVAVPDDGTYGGKIYSLAASQVGVREHGRNSGPEVDMYIRAGGGDVDSDPAWCQYFAYWAVSTAAEQMGGKTTSPKTGGVVKCWLRSEDSGSAQILPQDVLDGKVQLRAGDQMCRVRNGKPEDVAKVYAGIVRQGHTGIVERVVGTTVYTVEGNTNKAGSREGDGVYRKSIDLKSDVLIGFIRHEIK
jgi:hypothetical protein